MSKKPRNPQDNMENPTIHAVNAPDGDKDLRRYPCAAKPVAIKVDNVIAFELNGIILPIFR